MEQLECSETNVTLDIDGYKLKVPYDLTTEERHTIIGALIFSEKLSDDMKRKMILEIIKFSKRQMQ